MGTHPVVCPKRRSSPVRGAPCPSGLDVGLSQNRGNPPLFGWAFPERLKEPVALFLGGGWGRGWGSGRGGGFLGGFKKQDTGAILRSGGGDLV